MIKYDLVQANEILEEYSEPYSNIDNGNLFFAAHEFKAALKAEKQRSQGLIEALEFYADYYNYNDADIVNYCSIRSDNGESARQALAKHRGSE